MVSFIFRCLELFRRPLN